MPFPSEQTLASGQGQVPGLAKVLSALFSYLQAVWSAITASSAPSTVITGTLSLANGATATLEDFLYSGSDTIAVAFAVARVPARTVLVNRTATALAVGVLGDGGDKPYQLAQGEAMAFAGVLLSLIRVSNASGGTVELELVSEGTFTPLS